MQRQTAGGSFFYFDKASKTLYTLTGHHACASRDEAEQLVKDGKAQRYSKSEIEAVTAAVNHIALLQ
jgi:hypothetical protein